MALKVVSSSTPVNLKVVSNYGMQGVTYNPQQTAPSTVVQKTANPQPKTYSPQRTAPATTFQNPARAQDITPDMARRWSEEVDRQNAQRVIERKRVADAKNAELQVGKQNWAQKLGDKVTMGSLQRQRKGRELAQAYLKQNETDWGNQIVSRQRVYERKGAQLKDWVMQSSSEAEYNQRVKEATDWLDNEYNSIDKDIKDYNLTQLELSNYAELPLQGKLASAGRFTKDFVTGLGSNSWNALTWTASQPQRAVNTAVNFVDPNRQRFYYNGDEKKNPSEIIGKGSNPFSLGWDQLRKSYNASKDQRTIATSKAEEQRRLREGWRTIKVRDNDGTIKDHTFYYKPDAFSRAQIKYGDDVADLILDPLNFLGGLGAGSKGLKAGSKSDEFLKFAGKSKFMTNAVISGTALNERFKMSKFAKGIDWLKSEWKPRNVRAGEAVGALADELGTTASEFKIAKNNLYRDFTETKQGINATKRSSLREMTARSSRLEADRAGFKAQAQKLADDYVKRLNDFSDNEVRAMTRFARNGDWSRMDKLKINKYRRNELMSFVGDYQTKARALAKSEGLTRRAQNYLPEFTGRGYDPTASRRLFGDKYYGQSRQQLQESLINREFMSNYDGANDFLKQLSATEKSILRNAKRNNRTLSAFEKEQLALLDERKTALKRLTDKYDRRFTNIQGAMQKVRMDAKPLIRFNRRGVQTNWSKKGLMNSTADLFHLPSSVWKKSVLKYNPAWYVNNALWNLPASVSGGGAGVFNEYRKLITDARYWNEVRKKLPEGVMSKISQEIGKSGLATKIEDTSRVATFLALKKQGYTDEQALKRVNRWLFDYTTKNYERPIKALAPFYHWQKNIIRLGATMPFHSPKSAKVYSELYKNFYQRPLEELPNETQEYTDPDTGKTVTYNPRDFYKGKAKIGDNWYGLPFFAVNPDNAFQFGANPYLMSASDYLTSSDRLGDQNTDRKAWTILAERFPQLNLARKFANRDNKDSKLWFSESGNSKSAQGFDENSRNYRKSLDNRPEFTNSVKSFFGVPRAVKFDRDEYENKKRLTSFNKDFFAVNWDERLKAMKSESGDKYFGFDDPNSPYARLRAEQEALAKKYGFDLQKDIFDNYWSKYDTETTSNTKRLKKDAYDFNGDFWRDYLSLPQGSKTQASQRRPFLINKFNEWKRDHTFAKNPYYEIPEFSEYNTANQKTGNKVVKNPYVLEREENQSQIRRAEGKRKNQRRLAYEKAIKTGDWSYFDKNPSLARRERSERNKLWQEYYDLGSTRERRAFLDAHPEMSKFKTPTTQAEWDQLKTMIRTERRAKLSKLSGFETFKSQAEQKAMRLPPRRRTKRVKLNF